MVEGQHDRENEQRRPWVAPQLVKHASLTVLTQQSGTRDFVPPDSLGIDPAAPIPCSQGFCP